MKIEEDKNTLVREFEKLYNSYVRLKIETNRLEGSNGYIQKLFQEWNKTSIERMLRERNDGNLVLDQEKIEMERLQNGDNNSLRFFKPYYDDFSVQISKGEIPDFFKSKKIELDIEMPIRKDETEGFEKAKKQYIDMPKEKRELEKAKIIKGLALIYARQANIFNRFKTSEKVAFENAMKSKLNSMRNFLQYATLYNSMVSKEEQIAFGINDSEKGPLLEASLPGYTRLSVHFGNAKNCKETLEKTNEFLEGQEVKSYFPTFKDGKINLNAVYERRGYDLPKFDVVNTGLITRAEYEDLKIYEQQIRGKNTNAKVNSKRVEMFVNLMYPDLNDREIFYVAEKSEFGKKHLEDLKGILEEREERKKIADKSKKDIRSVYIEQEIENISDLKSKTKKINEFYLRYLETGNIKEDVRLDNFINILEDSNIDKGIIEIFIQSKEKEQEKDINDMEFEEILKLANSGKEISVDVFSSKFLQDEEPDYLYDISEDDNIPPSLKQDYFKTIFNNTDMKSKVILLFRTVETKFANELLTDEQSQDYREKSKHETENLEELVLNEVVNNESTEDYGEMLVEIISDASELINITNNDSSNKSEQIRLVKNLWENYEFVLSTSSESNEISEEEKKEFRKILDSYWVDEEICDDFENLTTDTYSKMKELAIRKNVKERKEIEKIEEDIIDANSKSI